MAFQVPKVSQKSHAASQTSHHAPAKPNPLFSLLLRNALAGALAAAIVTIGLIATDAHHLRSLIMAEENPILPIALLLFGLVITFSSIAMGWAIMALPYDEKPVETQGRDPSDL